MDKENKELQVDFKTAILRIFRILDKDRDGWLSDNDLMAMQERVFKMTLSKIHITSIKETVSKLKGQHSVSHGFNEDAFEGIFIKMLDMVKIKNCWVILNFFGYDNNLRLRVDPKEVQMMLEKYHTINLSK